VEAIMSSKSSGFRSSSVVRPVLLVAAATLLAACGTAPLSYLNDRQVNDRAQLHRFPVLVTQIDGKGTTFEPVPIAPGVHQVVMEAPPVAGFTLPVRKVYPMTIEPCTRYYIAAQRAAKFTQDWDLVIEVTYPVAGCDPAKELQKAGIASSGAPSSVLATIDPGQTALLPPTGIGQ
jgi:hypothetical protein